MANFPKKPMKGEKALQSIYNSLIEVIDYLPSLTVVGDNKTTSVNHSNYGTTIHALPQSININTSKKEGEQYTSGQFIEITSGNEINCTLTGGNYIEITPQGVINYTGPSGGGGGTSYFADGFTLSTTSPTGNTFCMYDVYPLITGGGGVTVSRYGDAPLYPGYALGTIISCPYYVGSGVIGIIDGAEGTYTKYIALTGDIDYNAGTGISIDPATRTINCTVEPGGGGNTYYVDNNTLSTQVVGTTSTFYVVNVSSLLTGAGGTEVYYYGTGLNNTIIAGISSHIYLPSTGIAIIDGEEGTYTKYIAVTGGVSTPIQPGSGLISTAHTDPNSNPYNPTITSITFDLSAHFYNDLISLSGRHDFGGGVILSSSNGNLVWSRNITKVSQLTNDVGYITSPGPAPTAYYADNDTLSTTDNGTRFYVRNISTLLTGAGGTTVYYYGTGLNDTIVAGISSYNFLPSTGIGLIDGDTGSYNKYIAVTGDFITSTWVADNFISGGSTGDHMYYNSQEKLLKCMLTGGTNIEIEDIGNYGYINCTLTGLDQLANTPGFITSPGPAPTAYYADNDTLSTTSNGTTFYVRNVSSLLTGAGGTTVYYYGTGLNNTIVAGISSYTYLPSTGIAILDDTTEGTCNKYIAVTGSFIDSSYYNFTNGLSTYNILDANNNVIGQNVGLVETYRTILNTLSGSTLNANHNKVLSSSNDGTISWQTNTTSSPNWTSLTPNLLSINNSTHQLSAATQGGGGGIANFAPDYSYLSASEDAGMTTNGLGVTFLLPVNAGDTYSVQSTGPTVVCTFAPVANSSTETTNVAANSTLTADTDGWVRVSVIDPGTSNGACVRFLVNGAPYANGLPLYKSKIMQNLTGDGDTIQIEGNQIKCISTPPPSSSSNGTAVQSKTSFCFSPDIYYAVPNTTYYTSYKHDVSDESQDLAYPEEDLQWYFDTDNYDQGGDIVLVLPEVDYPCMVKVTNFDDTYTAVITQDGKYIVGDDGGAQGWNSGQQSDRVGFNETKIYVFQPTPIHWSSSYSGISAAIENKGGVWWMQTFT